ncbi:HmuY family protein [Zunongwangia sp. SCSIO 43204]|uniref:HmuY family protein n=1 Tax=Zunongwangia sp. SCSIO 43204 TaxID=2779359 RepID=UPI001CA95F9C|nr:HmuY family protein [Zunongwangia sp. SCSIO 43204]UAB84948.1 HmuY family protein [Zunongwangia sp. SCSIO 43204]
MKKNLLLQLFCLSFIVFSCSSDDDNGGGIIEIPAVESAVLDIESGGSTEPNQVYVDLSTEETTVVRRDSWELGFVSSENRVVLNSSILASAAKLEGIYDIDAVSEDTELTVPMTLKTLNQGFQPIEVTVSTLNELKEGIPVGYHMYGDLENNIRFTDDSTGDLGKTAIGDIPTTETEAEVIIVSLGNEIPKDAAEAGSINTTGDHRGFYKIKVFMNNNDYVLQYAPLSSDTHEEVVITKDEAYDFTAFSLENGIEVDVEPAKENWDLNYTSVYSYYGSSRGLVAGVTYSDYVVHNTLNGVGVYMVLTEEPGEGEDAAPVATGEPLYDEFTLEDVNENEFEYNDRALIASGWRSSSEGALSDRYYIVRDTDGNFYKLQFTALLNEQGERGFPQIVYDLL